jgi:FKBP-type peptidyl-prolyl cis-trans isomerase SlyD
MPIGRGTVATLDYELKTSDGELLEDEGASLAYLHGGFGGIFPKVEAELEGKDVGDEIAITLEPEDAFGEYDAELLRVEPRDRFPAVIEVGMRFEGVPGDREDEALSTRSPTSRRRPWWSTATIPSPASASGSRRR